MTRFETFHTFSYAEYTHEDLTLKEFSSGKETLLISEAIHSHDLIEFIYILSGSGVIQINGKNFPIKTGSLIQLFPYHIHALKRLDKQADNIDYLFCRFPLSLLMMMDISRAYRYNSYHVLEEHSPVVCFPEEVLPEVSRFFKTIVNEDQKKETHYEKMILAELAKISILFERYSPQNDCDERQLAWKIIQFMHFHFNQKLNSETVAKKFSISVVKLNRLLHQLTEKNFVTNLHEIRIRNACAMLPFSDLSITYIHHFVGYSSHTTFYRIFRKLKGMTPEAFRQHKQTDTFSIAKQADIVWKIIVYMLDHYQETINAETVAQQLFMRPDAVADVLKNNLDISFHDLLTQIRMTYACSLLQATTLTIGDIAIQVGFNSIRTFNRLFYDYLGVSPKNYQKTRLTQ